MVTTIIPINQYSLAPPTFVPDNTETITLDPTHSFTEIIQDDLQAHFDQKPPFFYLKRYQDALRASRNHQETLGVNEPAYDTFVPRVHDKALIDQFLTTLRSGNRQSFFDLLLHLKCIEQDSELFKYSIQYDKEYEYLYTLLCFAVRTHSLPFIALLLDCGVKPHGFKDKGWNSTHSLLYWAIEYGNNADCIRLLFKYAKNKKFMACDEGPKGTPLQRAFKKNNAAIIKELLVHGAYIPASFSRRYLSIAPKEERLFIKAACLGHIELVSLFHKAGFPLNYQNSMGRTALHYAAVNRQKDVVAFLLEKGADESLKDMEQKNYLEFSNEILKRENSEALACLMHKISRCYKTHVNDNLDHLLDVNVVVNEEGDTLLHLALRQKRLNEAVIKGLLERGANPTHENKSQETALSL